MGATRLQSLSRVLTIKIVLTLVFWCVPLLLFPADWLAALGFPVPEPRIFLRLLGMAYAALVLGYSFGLRAAQRGEYPAGVVWVGIVSNAGASVLLALAASAGAWETWGAIAQGLMWASLFGTMALAAALVWLGPRRMPDAGT